MDGQPTAAWQWIGDSGGSMMGCLAVQGTWALGRADALSPGRPPPDQRRDLRSTSTPSSVTQS